MPSLWYLSAPTMSPPPSPPPPPPPPPPRHNPDTFLHLHPLMVTVLVIVIVIIFVMPTPTRVELIPLYICFSTAPPPPSHHPKQVHRLELATKLEICPHRQLRCYCSRDRGYPALGTAPALLQASLSQLFRKYNCHRD